MELNRTEEAAILHWTENTRGIQLVKKIIDEECRQKLAQRYYRPYYQMLDILFEKMAAKQPAGAQPISFIDLHSMPASPTSYHLKINPQQKTNRANFCLSDLKGVSCNHQYITSIADALNKKGYTIAINDPYFGGNITKYLHSLHDRFPLNVVQIEVNRSIYMNEDKRTFLDTSKITKVKNDLTETLISLFNR
ncbi:MAG: N-formylglutamate amidohydrolase [Oligoflexia bacterium]|nr:N-formylglutamate amidohydrolase [Oligoflexia bacterium]